MPAASTDYFPGWLRNDTNGNHHHYYNNHYMPRSSPSTPRSTPYSSRHNSPASLPSSPVHSPLSLSPAASFRRNYSSTFTLIPEDRAIDVPPIYRRRDPDVFRTPGPIQNKLLKAILWWPLLLLTFLKKIIFVLLAFIFTPLSFAAPTFWISACLWLFWKSIALPLAIVKYLLFGYNASFDRNRAKRTVLISCGSTIQALHLARNFYSAGARVIVFDFDSLFGLARFSTAVSKYYTVPKPGPDTARDYISALCNIVEKERPTFYIPVCATSVAHYDALAKPHLELLGCKSFIPGRQEISVLDDILEITRKCIDNDIAVPPHKVLSCKEDLVELYESGWTAGYRNIITLSGTPGILERQKYVLPSHLRDFKFNHEISEDKQWVVVRDVPGTHYVTCTTVKESKVVANVTCSVEQESRSLVPEENKDVDKWLDVFFEKIHLLRPINGHISFRLVQCQKTGNLLPLGTRIGVSLPYICHTGVHSRVLCKPCPHFSRKNSGPLVQNGGRYWIPEVVYNTLKHPSVDAVGKLIGTVLDKREALFVYWDPLPYCAYYHFQLPFRSVKKFLQNRQTGHSRHSPTLTAPVH